MPSIIACATSCYGNKIDLYKTLESIVSIGFKGIEIMSIPDWFEHVTPENMNKKSILELKKKLHSLNLTPIAISGHCELGRKAGANQLEERIRFTANLEIDIIVIGSGNIRNKTEENNFFKAIERNIDVAERYDVTIVLETGGSYIPTGKKMHPILTKINSPYLKAAYDPANVVSWGNADPIADVQYILPYLSHIHIKDYKKGLGFYPPIGSGDIDFNNFFATLASNNYKGNFSVEVDCLDTKNVHNNLLKSMTYIYTKTNFLDLFK